MDVSAAATQHRSQCRSRRASAFGCFADSQKPFFVEKSYDSQAIQAFTSFVINLFYSEKRILDLQSGAGPEWK